MPTPAWMIKQAAGLMNDSAQTLYTNDACLPYLNMSLNILQELFELNNIPITNKTSGIITVPAGVSAIGFGTTPPLPADLVEIEELWESKTGQNKWVPVTKDSFIPNSLLGTPVSGFGIWAWKNNQVEVIAAIDINDLKIDYIGSIFATPILIGAINTNIPVANIETFIEFETAALCAMFIGENETRAAALNNLAGDALSRALGIPIKGMQAIVTRRRPFRANYKRKGVIV